MKKEITLDFILIYFFFFLLSACLQVTLCLDNLHLTFTSFSPWMYMHVHYSEPDSALKPLEYLCMFKCFKFSVFINISNVWNEENQFPIQISMIKIRNMNVCTCMSKSICYIWILFSNCFKILLKTQDESFIYPS